MTRARSAPHRWITIRQHPSILLALRGSRCLIPTTDRRYITNIARSTTPSNRQGRRHPAIPFNLVPPGSTHVRHNRTRTTCETLPLGELFRGGLLLSLFAAWLYWREVACRGFGARAVGPQVQQPLGLSRSELTPAFLVPKLDLPSRHPSILVTMLMISRPWSSRHSTSTTCVMGSLARTTLG